MMSDYEIIKEYLNEAYILTYNKREWVAKNKFNGKAFNIKVLGGKLNKIFPNMNPEVVCDEWYSTNISLINNKINTYLNNFTLSSSNNIYYWVLVNKFGKEVNEETIIDGIVKLLPNYHSIDMIKNIYDKWYEDLKYDQTQKLIGC